MPTLSESVIDLIIMKPSEFLLWQPVTNEIATYTEVTSVFANKDALCVSHTNSPVGPEDEGSN